MALLQHHLAVGGVHEELDVAVTERHAGDDLVHLDLVTDRGRLTGVLLTDGPGLVQPLVGQERMRHGAQPTACPGAGRPDCGVANEDQARFWNEDGGPRWVSHEQWFDTMLEPFEAALEAAADVQPGDHALDVGCGFGTTTLALARAVGPEGRVMAVDLSDVMVERVRARATGGGLTNVITRVADAQTDPLPASHFAVAVSRFGVM